MHMIPVTPAFALVTADTSTSGLVTVSDNSPFLPGCLVHLAGTGETSVECMVVEQLGSDQIRLRALTNPAKDGRGSDLSAFTLAKASSVNMGHQIVRVNKPFVPVARR